MPQLLGKLCLRQLRIDPDTDEYLSLDRILRVLMIGYHFPA